MSSFDLLDNKKTELENIREEVMRGHQVRSCVQWLSEGERPTKYFCSLEHRNYLDKTIKKVIKEDGLVLTDPKSILGELRNFYSKLFKCSDHRLDLFIYLGFYVTFNTVQVISRRVVGRAEETSTYSSLGFCTVNCRPTASNYQLSHLRLCRGSNPGLRGGRRECYHSATVAP